MAILIKYARKHSIYLGMHSSCYSLETRHLLYCTKSVWSITEVTEVLQLTTTLDHKVDFFKGRTNKLRR